MLGQAKSSCSPTLRLFLPARRYDVRTPTATAILAPHPFTCTFALAFPGPHLAAPEVSPATQHTTHIALHTTHIALHTRVHYSHSTLHNSVLPTDSTGRTNNEQNEHANKR